jgi:hypothetical protein
MVFTFTHMCIHCLCCPLLGIPTFDQCLMLLCLHSAAFSVVLAFPNPHLPLFVYVANIYSSLESQAKHLLHGVFSEKDMCTPSVPTQILFIYLFW